jgi:hypothetical protein
MSMHTEELGLHWTNFRVNRNLEFLLKLRTFQFWLKLVKNNTLYIHEDLRKCRTTLATDVTIIFMVAIIRGRAAREIFLRVEVGSGR